MSFKSIELLAESRILKHEGEYLFLHKGDVLKCLKICEFLSLSVCSFILVEKFGRKVCHYSQVTSDITIRRVYILYFLLCDVTNGSYANFFYVAKYNLG